MSRSLQLRGALSGYITACPRHRTTAVGRNSQCSGHAQGQQTRVHGHTRCGRRMLRLLASRRPAVRQLPGLRHASAVASDSAGPASAAGDSLHPLAAGSASRIGDWWQATGEDAPALMLRGVARRVAGRLQYVQSGGDAAAWAPGVMLHGQRGMGKSSVLAAVQDYALDSSEWCVLNVGPFLVDWTRGVGSVSQQGDVYVNQEQLVQAMRQLRDTSAVPSGKASVAVPAELQASVDGQTSVDLAEAVVQGAKGRVDAHNWYSLLMTSLMSQQAFPVLVLADSADVLFAETGYQSATGQLLQASDLALTAPVLQMLQRGLRRGILVGAWDARVPLSEAEHAMHADTIAVSEMTDLESQSFIAHAKSSGLVRPDMTPAHEARLKFLSGGVPLDLERFLSLQ